GKLLPDQRHVVFAGRTIEPVHRREHRFAVDQARKAGTAAACQYGESAARLAHRPFEQRVMAAGDDRRRAGGLSRRSIRFRSEPGIDLCARKQQLARRTDMRQCIRAHQIVDPPLLEPQIRGDFARIHHRGRRGRCGGISFARHAPILARERAPRYLPARTDSRDRSRATAPRAMTINKAGTRYDSASCGNGIASPRNASLSNMYWPVTGTRTSHSGSRCCRNNYTAGTIETTNISTETLV